MGKYIFSLAFVCCQVSAFASTSIILCENSSIDAGFYAYLSETFPQKIQELVASPLREQGYDGPLSTPTCRVLNAQGIRVSNSIFKYECSDNGDDLPPITRELANSELV